MQLWRKHTSCTTVSISSSILFLMLKIRKIWRKAKEATSFLNLCLCSLFYVPSTSEKGFEMAVTGGLGGGQVSRATVVMFLNKTTRAYLCSSWDRNPYSTSKPSETEGSYFTLFSRIKHEFWAHFVIVS